MDISISEKVAEKLLSFGADSILIIGKEKDQATGSYIRQTQLEVTHDEWSEIVKTIDKMRAVRDKAMIASRSDQ